MLSALAKADIQPCAIIIGFSCRNFMAFLIQAIAVLLIISVVTVLFALRRIRKISVLNCCNKNKSSVE